MEGEPEGVQAYVLPVMSRPGGFLAAMPDKILSGELLLDVLMKEDAGAVGPSREFNAQLMVEEELADGNIALVDLDSTTNFLIVDLDDSVLGAMREYDVVTDSHEPIVPFDADEPNALPKISSVLQMVVEWIDAVAHEKLHFYSAREEPMEKAATSARKAVPKKTGRATLATLTAQLATLQQQVQAVAAQQDVLARQSPLPSGSANPAPELANGPMIGKMPSLSSNLLGGTVPKTAAALLGPPPRTKNPRTVPTPAQDVEHAVAPIQSFCAGSGEHQIYSTLSTQSAALTSLVAHLTGGDPMSDLASGLSSQGAGLSTKGVARREKMQSDLAMRTSTYFLQVQQQLYKRMNPARAVPKSATELAQADISMTSYLERYGGYKGCKETGLVMWIVAHAMDAAAQEDFYAVKEYLALLTAALEQSALDGTWNVAYILSLMEEPPHQLFVDRPQPIAATGRPFAPLVPPMWAAVALSYLKELEILTTRKADSKKTSTQSAPSGSVSSEGSPASPKRKPRFPKKPKAGAESS
eukprot:s3041_g7.t1